MSQFQVPVLGQFKYLFMMQIFIIFGIHRNIIYVLTESFQKVKVGAISYNYQNIANDMALNFSYYFMIAIKLALPVIGILFIVDIVLGIMARIAPQMNVFFLGMPLKILIGFIFLITFVPYTVSFFGFLANDSYVRLGEILKNGVK
jgi:flagellar biosynthetic protein FliR